MSCSFIGLSISLLVWMARPAYSQSPGINGPVAGLVYNRDSRSVRPLLGIPGATYMASAVLSNVDWASIAPDGRWAFVAQAGANSFVQGLSSANPTSFSPDGMIQADRIVWNRDGSFALLYSFSASQLQRVRLSDNGAAPDPPIDLTSLGQPAVLAIDPTGQQIAFGIPGSGLYLFSAGQSPALLSSMATPAAIAFDQTGGRLYAADLGQQQIVAFDSGNGPIPFASLAQTDGSVLSPVGLAVSAGNRYLLLADKSGNAVLVYDITSGPLTNRIALDFAPSRLDALTTGPTFLLNGDNSNEWLLVLDGRQTPGVYFVPASQQEPL